MSTALSDTVNFQRRANAKSDKCSLFISINIVSGKRRLFSTKTENGDRRPVLFTADLTRHFEKTLPNKIYSDR